MTCMAVMAVIVFIALFFFKAGYGYLSSSNWGPKISNKVAWVLMEAPAFLFLLYYTIRFALSGAETRSFYISWPVSSCFTISSVRSSSLF